MTIANFIEKTSRFDEQSAARFGPPLRLRCMSGNGCGGPLCETVVRVGKQPMGMGCSPLYLWSTGVEDDVLYVVIVGCAGMINW